MYVFIKTIQTFASVSDQEFPLLLGYDSSVLTIDWNDHRGFLITSDHAHAFFTFTVLDVLDMSDIGSKNYLHLHASCDKILSLNYCCWMDDFESPEKWNWRSDMNNQGLFELVPSENAVTIIDATHETLWERAICSYLESYFLYCDVVSDDVLIQAPRSIQTHRPRARDEDVLKCGCYYVAMMMKFQNVLRSMFHNVVQESITNTQTLIHVKTAFGSLFEKSLRIAMGSLYEICSYDAEFREKIRELREKTETFVLGSFVSLPRDLSFSHALTRGFEVFVDETLRARHMNHGFLPCKVFDVWYSAVLIQRAYRLKKQKKKSPSKL